MFLDIREFLIDTFTPEETPWESGVLLSRSLEKHEQYNAEREKAAQKRNAPKRKKRTGTALLLKRAADKEARRRYYQKNRAKVLEAQKEYDALRAKEKRDARESLRQVQDESRNSAEDGDVGARTHGRKTGDAK